MGSKTQNPLIEKLNLLTSLDDQECRQILNLCENKQNVERGQYLSSPDEDYVSLLLDGWACRYKLLKDGRRQITRFILPGDLSGVRACLFGISDFTTEALMTCQVAWIRGRDVADLFVNSPRLAAAITWASAREEAMLSEHVVSLGRRNARERMAHLFLELHSRLESVGIVDRMAYELPITQEMIADTLGLSIVHVNRTIKTMRDDGLLEYRAGYVILKEPKELSKICGFNSDHLDGALHPQLEDLI